MVNELIVTENKLVVKPSGYSYHNSIKSWNEAKQNAEKFKQLLEMIVPLKFEENRVYVAEDEAGYLIGKKGSRIRKIEEVTGKLKIIPMKVLKCNNRYYGNSNMDYHKANDDVVKETEEVLKKNKIDYIVVNSGNYKEILINSIPENLKEQLIEIGALARDNHEQQ